MIALPAAQCLHVIKSSKLCLVSVIGHCSPIQLAQRGFPQCVRSWPPPIEEGGKGAASEWHGTLLKEGLT